MNIAVTGDVFLGGDLAASDIEPIEVAAYANADLRVINLEQAVSDRPNAESKSTLYTGTEALPRLRAMDVDIAGIANNHVHDKFAVGVADTREHLSAAGVLPAGAGANRNAARAPAILSDSLVLLGYCDFDRPYLRNVLVSEEGSAGVNPLRLESILADLERLPIGTRALLYFHWGQEHLWLPPARDLRLSRLLLAHPKVIGIVGNHAHRAQGYIEVEGKRAYMCLGNFLFPNFYLTSPSQLALPPAMEVKAPLVTRRYHRVHELTYKKWKLANRISLVVTIDSETGLMTHRVVCQDDDRPVVRDARWALRIAVLLRVLCLSWAYRLPESVYRPVQRMAAIAHTATWRFAIYRFDFRQVGWRGFMKLTANRLGR